MANIENRRMYSRFYIDMKKILLRLFAIIFFAAVFSDGAFAAEVINNFHADIKVRADGQIEVHEIITVTSEEKEIKHGIYRDIPTAYKTAEGKRFDSGFRLQQVMQDGAPQKYFTRGEGSGIRIYIGDKNKKIPSGQYTYEIFYTFRRILGFFDDHDELYWNVTGNGWTFPIHHASARVSLPEIVPTEKIITDFYTGKLGSKNQNATATVSSTPEVFFETTKSLAKSEGLTIVVGWPKGIVWEAPIYDTYVSTTAQEKGPTASRSTHIIFSVLAFLFQLGYFVYVWHKSGRDPDARVVIAQYEPPQGMSPIVARFLKRHSLDSIGIGAQIIDMAARNLVTIEIAENGNYRISKLVESSSDLAQEDAIIIETLFKKKDSITIKGVYGKEQTPERTVMRNLNKALILYLEKKYLNSILFLNRRNYWRGVLLVTPLALVLSIAPAPGELPATILVNTGLTTLVVLTYLGLARIVSFLTDVKPTKNVLRGILNTMFVMFRFMFMLVFGVFGYIAMLYIVLGTLGENIVGPQKVLLVALPVVIVLFAKLMPRYTEEGARLIEHIDGFKLFLGATEKDRFEFHHPPEKTPKLFQKYLGYACALGVQQKWSAQFATILFEASRDEQSYHNMNSRSNFAGFAGNFKQFSSGISGATMTSTGGLGGGGSSGGGGGGGGGGGW